MSVAAEPAGAEALRELIPLLGPVAVIESVRTRPVAPVAFKHAKIIYVTDGTSMVTTVTGRRLLGRGDVMALGGGVWCAATPRSRVRTWTVYLDAKFLREQMSWVLPDTVPLPDQKRPGLWDGTALFTRLDDAVLTKLEPVLRQMSVLSDRGDPAAVAALIAGFARTVELTVCTTVPTSSVQPVVDVSGVGPLTVPMPPASVERAARMLREDFCRAWTLNELAQSVALSSSQLARRFAQHYGVTPMRWLAEIRLTEFARLIEETTLTVEQAARRVGWADRRVAAAWFRRRYGLSPTEFRARPLAVCSESPCVLCAGGACARAGALGGV